jgi:cell division protein FtsN
MSHTNIQSQRGGTLLGFVLGLVIGLIIALGVAMYVTKVPMPFSNKNQSRSADQDAVEAEKTKTGIQTVRYKASPSHQKHQQTLRLPILPLPPQAYPILVQPPHLQ